MTRYLGGLITADETKTIPANNFEDTSAPGIWTLSEAEMLNKQSLWPTAGVSNPVNFIENLFSVDTYTGNATARSITTGIDLANEGGLVWGKARSGAYNHWWYDTVRGAEKPLVSNTNGAEQSTSGAGLTAFNSDGFSLSASSWWNENQNSITEVAWTFRKASKFFDMVTYTGDGSTSGRQIAHSLGSTPGMIIFKRTDASAEWIVYHTSIGATKFLYLNSFDQAQSNLYYFNNTEPTSTHFTLRNNGNVNASGGTYIAYLFGHETSSDSMIKCGSFSTDSGSQGNHRLRIRTSMGYVQENK